MNKVIVTGNLTRTPELKAVTVKGSDTSVCSFTVASNRKFKKANGEQAEEVTFINCELWSSGAEIFCKYCNKGDKVLVEGSIRNERWEDRDGNKRSRDKIRVNNFEKLRSKNGYVPEEDLNTPTVQSAATQEVEEATPF